MAWGEEGGRDGGRTGRGGGNEPFDVLRSDVYGEQFEKTCIYSKGGGRNHTETGPRCLASTCARPAANQTHLEDRRSAGYAHLISSPEPSASLSGKNLLPWVRERVGLCFGSSRVVRNQTDYGIMLVIITIPRSFSALKPDSRGGIRESAPRLRWHG